MLNQDQKTDISQAIQVMKKGGVILCPTDTIWGLSCDSCNEVAISRIYEIKRRNDAKALISLVDDMQKIEFYVPEIPPVAWDLVDCAHRPLTIIYDHVRNLSQNLLAEDGSAAIRVVKEEFIRTLCMRMKRAIVSTSANISGTPSPQQFSDIPQEIIDAVDYVCLSGRESTQNSQASSIIKLSASSEVTIIRP